MNPTDTKKEPTDDWKRQASGLYLPRDLQPGGKKRPVGFARALEGEQ